MVRDIIVNLGSIPDIVNLRWLRIRLIALECISKVDFHFLKYVCQVDHCV